MNMTLQQFEATLKTAVANVFHREAEKQAVPYTVWHEYRKNYYKSDNRVSEAYWRVQVDHYSKNKSDPEADVIEAVLDAINVLSSRSTYYEPDTRLTRNMFICEVW